LGYAGVYSSFLLFVQRASERYGIPSHEVLLGTARRKAIGGQEDLVEQIALELAESDGVK